jgi:hypothetical protein
MPLIRWDYRVVRGPYAGRDCHPLASLKAGETKVLFRDCEVGLVRLEDLTPRRYGAFSDTAHRPVPVRPRPKWTADQKAARRILKGEQT